MRAYVDPPHPHHYRHAKRATEANVAGTLVEFRGKRPGLKRSCSARGRGDADSNGWCGFAAGRSGPACCLAKIRRG